MPSKIDQYTLIKKLGAGISATVYLATDAQNKRFALKVFDKSNPKNSAKAMETVAKEVEIY